MKKILKNSLLSFFIIVLLNTVFAQPTHNIPNCEKTVQFGDIEVCLPFISGMRECYSVPRIKLRADETEAKGTTSLGFYLNLATYNKLNSSEAMYLDDYIKIYSTDSYKNKKFVQTDLNLVSKNFSNYFLSMNWKDLQLEKGKGNHIVIGQKPIIIESYSPDSKVRTHVILMNIKIGDIDKLFICTLSIINIKERIILMAYYKEYSGEPSIKKAKYKNDNICLLVTSHN